jgi:hypothetical protein
MGKNSYTLITERKSDNIETDMIVLMPTVFIFSEGKQTAIVEMFVNSRKSS